MKRIVLFWFFLYLWGYSFGEVELLKRFAYVTLLYGDDCLLGARVLGQV